MLNWKVVSEIINDDEVDWKEAFKILANNVCNFNFSHPLNTEDIIDVLINSSK